LRQARPTPIINAKKQISIGTEIRVVVDMAATTGNREIIFNPSFADLKR
jgi:hypothetical protein